ncbi:SPFH domain-containing protein [Paenibacillus sp. N1-5-1-14]|uniref:SPFH domain-containing protein n=1 Tax=Paenibacillus radicibacter TaxID=2972488 RepID=UPI0021599F71|nr:SPFH domain-containing protein [Paenibacillus radicibacter]MCR8642946.1 SPFH domain-containing protein [Paenibacillus radicibacter]
MAIVEVVKFDGPSDLFVWKYPNQELGTWTQLIVNETQEAILFKGGKALDLFGPGRHTLDTANIPFVQALVNLPFGGRSPFTAEVWYINKINSLDVKWGTASPLQLQDPKYQIILSIRSFGQFGVQIEDSRKFLLKLIGTMPVFDKDTLVKYFRSLLMMNINELITSYLVLKKISILEINAYIAEIAKHIEERIGPVFREYGIKLLNFYIDSINMPDDDPTTIRLKEALAKKAEMDIIGYTYQQQRTFDTLEGAAKNEGSGSSNVMGAGIGLGMGFGVGGAVGGQMAGLTQEMNTSAGKPCLQCHTINREDSRFCNNCGYSYVSAAPIPVAAAKATDCSVCGKSFPANAKFCPHCGDENRPCPNCGSDNSADSESCIKCGYNIGVKLCPSCSDPLIAGAKFCSNCGGSAVLKCSQCQHEVKPGQKFCLECGNKLIP